MPFFIFFGRNALRLQQRANWLQERKLLRQKHVAHESLKKNPSGESSAVLKMLTGTDFFQAGLSREQSSTAQVEHIRDGAHQAP